MIIGNDWHTGGISAMMRLLPIVRKYFGMEPKVAEKLYNTPIMSSAVSDANKVVEEINDLSKTYTNDKEKFSEEAINTCIKYEIISKENVEILKEKGKLK